MSHGRMLLHTVNRLRHVDDRARFQEIAAQEIVRPVFIIAMPRTGTTILHDILAWDPRSRAPLTWEVMFPSPPQQREVVVDVGDGHPPAVVGLVRDTPNRVEGSEDLGVDRDGAAQVAEATAEAERRVVSVGAAARVARACGCVPTLRCRGGGSCDHLMPATR